MSSPLFYMTISCEVSLSNFRCSSNNRTHRLSLSLFLSLLLKQVLSCLTSSMSHTWIIDLGATNHMTGNRGSMSSFTPASYSNSVVLADNSHTLIQIIDTATTTSLFLYHLFSIYFVFLSTYYQ